MKNTAKRLVAGAALVALAGSSLALTGCFWDGGIDHANDTVRVSSQGVIDPDAAPIPTYVTTVEERNAALAEAAQAGAPDVPVTPADHAGRFESMGAQGCFGCHGGEGVGGAVPLPASHYVDGDAATGEMDPLRAACYTCHG